MYPDECVEFIFATMPPELLRDLTTLIYRAYPTAHRESSAKYPPKIARDHYPFERRSKIEAGLLQIPRKHPTTEAVSVPNRRDTGYHTRLRVDQIILTQSKTDSPKAPPRDAEFRRSYAEKSQLAFNVEGLRPPGRFKHEVEPDALYVLLVHGPAEDTLWLPAFVHLAIPNREGTEILRTINLAPYLADESRPEVQIAPAEPRLKVEPDQERADS